MIGKYLSCNTIVDKLIIYIILVAITNDLNYIILKDRGNFKYNIYNIHLNVCF